MSEEGREGKKGKEGEEGKKGKEGEKGIIKTGWEEQDLIEFSDLPIWSTPFLLKLRELPNVRAACEYAGISRVAAYKLRDKSLVFKRLWVEAVQDSIDRLEESAYERAIEGKSDTLLVFLLKAYRPEVFDVGRRDIEVENEQGLAFELTEDERIARLQKLLGRVEERDIIEGEAREVK